MTPASRIAPLRRTARGAARTLPALLIALGWASAAAAQDDDPTARAMAAKALAAADAPAITKTTIVGTDIPGTPAVSDPNGTIGNSPIQVNATDPTTTGYLAFKYGADGKGVINYWVKTRGKTMNSYDAVQQGDRIVMNFWQAGTGSQTGHVGGTKVTVDNAAFTAGEVAGRWSLFTGTGIHSSQASKEYPHRFSSLNAIVANSYQQVLFPGGIGGGTPPESTNFGGWVVIGAGAASPGFGPLKFTAAGAALLTVPEPGAFEVDTSATPYFTSADRVRRAFVLADTATPAVAVQPGAGTGATATIDAQGNSGMVTLTTGAGATSGPAFTVTYAHPYATASYPVISAANSQASTMVKDAYLTATAAGFTLSLPSAPVAGTSYAITFYAPGR